MIRITSTLLALALIFLFAPQLRAQYSLSETGLMLGGGAGILSGGETTLGPSLHMGGFFSHYTCGKRYGFHFAGGAGLDLNRSGNSNSSGSSVLDQNAALSIGYLYLGAYGKIRPHTYHRPKEICFLVGPQLEVPLLTRYATDSLSGSLKEAGADVPTLLPAIHVSAQFRRPMGDELSFFIEPGVDAQLSPLYSTSGGARSCMRVTLALGVSFWNDH
jgi:hypothetical protein